MHWLTWTFLLLLLASTATRGWLNQRQVAAVRMHRSQVPAAFAAQIDLAAHQKAADYPVASARVSRWDSLLDTLLALVFTLGGGINLVDQWWRPLGLPASVNGTAVVLTVLLLLAALSLPLSIWRTF